MCDIVEEKRAALMELIAEVQRNGDRDGLHNERIVRLSQELDQLILCATQELAVEKDAADQ